MKYKIITIIFFGSLLLFIAFGIGHITGYDTGYDKGSNDMLKVIDSMYIIIPKTEFKKPSPPQLHKKFEKNLFVLDKK